MVRIEPPPPTRAVNPVHALLPAGDRLFRIYDPVPHEQGPADFRRAGPIHRFDHHRGPPAVPPPHDPDRAVLYGAFGLAGCLVEVFGDSGVIDLGTKRLARLHVLRDLTLLDLRGSGAMRAGTVAALAKVEERGQSQAWARHFYAAVDDDGLLDGLLYFNAHNDDDAFVLFERAERAVECRPRNDLSLRDSRLRPAILKAALENNLLPPPL